MSANYPPPQQPAPGQNPYGPPPQAPYGAPPQGAWGAPPQQPGFNGAAYPPPAPMAPMAQRDNAGLGILAGLGAVVVAALLYGLLIKGIKHEIGWAALAVGALVGLALGKIGGRNPVLPFVGIPLALLGVYLGQLFGLALIAASANDVGVVDVFTQHFSFLQHAWKESLGAKDFLFFGIAGLEGFVFTKRVAR